jgi:hypothetical protein
MIWKSLILNFQIPLCGCIHQNLKKVGRDLSLNSFIRFQKKKFKKNFNNKKKAQLDSVEPNSSKVY